MNLLTDKLLTPKLLDQKNVAPMTLPEVLAILHDEAYEIIGFDHLQPYQAHAWYSFLTQLSAIARNYCSEELLEADLQSPENWLKALRLLTLDYKDDAPWLLITDDIKKPAFMQPPVTEDNLNAFETEITPDAIDLLIQSKNHDIKIDKIQTPEPSHWIYALISLQTTQGFSGRGNYGISRMNGGFGNRSSVSFVTNPFFWGQRLRDDVVSLLKYREKICDDFSFKSEKGLNLLWVTPWDGTTSLKLFTLDPFYIEVCRRIRLQNKGNRIICLRKATLSSRIEAKNELGNVGDPWLAIVKNEKNEPNKSLTVPEGGFAYSLAQSIIFSPSIELTQVQKEAGRKKQSFCLMQTLVRGQGETKGYYERIIPIPLRNFDTSIENDETKRNEAASFANEMVLHARQYEKILKDSLLTFFQGSRDFQNNLKKLNYKDDRATSSLKQFDKEIDKFFFEFVWKCVESKDLKLWLEKIEEITRIQFNNAVKEYSTESLMYIKNRAESERWLNYKLATTKKEILSKR